ncbi:MAG: hypothetical protein R3B09_22515 [Nannocystaceae bacterium]
MLPAYIAARSRPIFFGAISLVIAGTLFAHANHAQAAPNWSSAPRWNLPAKRNPCPSGWKHRRGRRVSRLDRVECAELVAPLPPTPTPSPAPRPAAKPGPGVAPSPAPAPAPAPRPRPAAPVAVPDLRGYPDANALAAMNTRQCHAYLRDHEVSFTPLTRREAPEVDIPIRLTGALAGVTFTIPWSEDPMKDPHTIWDCRMAAAMIPLARWLRAYDVREIAYFSSLRRGGSSRSQHRSGLAFDLLGVRRSDGELMKVETHYPRRRLRSCPAVAEAPAAGADIGEIYLGLVCEAVRGGLLHTVLTPDHDRAHDNHLHLDLKEGQRSPVDPYVSFAGP